MIYIIVFFMCKRRGVLYVCFWIEKLIWCNIRYIWNFMVFCVGVVEVFDFVVIFVNVLFIWNEKYCL